jgi:PAS domain S-box-containing protein
MDDNPTYNELEQKVKESENEVAKRKELKKHWQILSSAIDGSSEGMAIIDLDGNLHYLNSAFAEVHGYSVNDLLGKHFSIFHTQQQMPSVKAANRQVKEKGTFIGEIWHTRRDGTVFPTIMHNSLIRDEEDKPVYFLGTLRDISEQKKLEEDLRKERDKSQHYLNPTSCPKFLYCTKSVSCMSTRIDLGTTDFFGVRAGHPVTGLSC